MLGNLIAIFVIVVMGFAIMPMLTSEVNNVLNNSEAFSPGNLTGNALSGSAASLLAMVPTFFGLGILLFMIAMIWRFLRSMGIIGGGEGEMEGDYDGDGKISEEEETIRALKEGQEDEIEEAEREEREKSKPRKKTKYELRAEKIEQEIEGYKDRTSSDSTDIESVDYHNTNKAKKKSSKEKDPYLNDFDSEEGNDKEDSFTKKGKFD